MADANNIDINDFNSLTVAIGSANARHEAKFLPHIAPEANPGQQWGEGYVPCFVAPSGERGGPVFYGSFDTLANAKAALQRMRDEGDDRPFLIRQPSRRYRAAERLRAEADAAGFAGFDVTVVDA